MGVLTRPDSPWWWLYLETTKEKIKTDIRVGLTVDQRRDSRRLAEALYHQTVNDRAARVYKLPTAKPAIRFSAYADAYQRDVISGHRAAAQEISTLNQLRRFFGSDLLSLIDPERVTAYRRARQAAGVSDRTINKDVDLLVVMLKRAVPQYLAASPLVGLVNPTPPPVRRPLLSRADERKILQACSDGQDRALVIVAVDTWIRLGDLIDLRWSDRRGPRLHVREPKNGVPYHAVLSTRAAQALDTLGHDDPEFLFPKFRRAANGRDRSTVAGKRFKRLCARAGVRYGRDAGGVTFHTATRRTGASRALNDDGISIALVQKQGGWKTARIPLEIYGEAEDAQQLAAFGPKPKRKTA